VPTLLPLFVRCLLLRCVTVVRCCYVGCPVYVYYVGYVVDCVVTLTLLFPLLRVAVVTLLRYALLVALYVVVVAPRVVWLLRCCYVVLPDTRLVTRWLPTLRCYVTRLPRYRVPTFVPHVGCVYVAFTVYSRCVCCTFVAVVVRLFALVVALYGYAVVLRIR